MGCGFVGWGTWLRLCMLMAHCMSVCHAFLPNFWSQVLTLSWNSYTHQYMTEQALLNVTMETLRMMPEQDFGSLQQADLGRGFWLAVSDVVRANADMDFGSSTREDPAYHFDSELVEEATQVVRGFWKQTILMAQEEHQEARRSLGRLLHTLQDFYSHSNWVEMGHRFEYLHVLHPREPAVPLASEDTPTCISCHRFSCYNNLLDKLVEGSPEPLLTTGYVNKYPAKPTGKCSHGGVLDSSRHQGAEGGINKDSTSPLFSPHHYLHKEAAELAATATLSVLRDLRDEVGHKSFLRLFSVQEAPPLVIVMDTTGSMFEEITAARLRVLSIIQARAKSHTPSLSGSFLLVPFHDPGVGPVQKTDDPEEFQQFLEDLIALGGGDEPEMCLSAIQLALIHSPPQSEIFVFTDASPKDIHLYDTVKALILEKQSKVTFLLTEDLDNEVRGRKILKRKRRQTLSPDRFTPYSSLASVSGGMTIFTTNKDIHKASAVVEDSTTSRKVTLFHVESEADSAFTFTVDRAVRTAMLQVSGNITQCVIISPTGAHQALLSTAGPLAELEQSEGLYRIFLLPPLQPGQWRLTVATQGPVTFSVLGESMLEFLYHFALEVNDTHPGLRRMQGSPVAGVPAFLVVAVIGMSRSDDVTFSHVTLLGTNGQSLQQVLLNSSSSIWSGEELVGRVDSVPRIPFSVRLSGKDGKGNDLERVSTETVQPTHVQILVRSAPPLWAGHRTAVFFEVFNHGPARHFTVTAEDDRHYLSETKSYRLSVAERGSVVGQVEVYPPPSTPAGQTVTLTLTVQTHDSSDSNYAVVSLIVLPEEQDRFPPVCSVMRVELACSSQCTLGNWSISLSARDRGHSGLASIQLSVGQGTLTLLHEDSTGRIKNSLVQFHEQTTQGHEEVTYLQQQSSTRPVHEADRLEKVRLVQGDAPLNIRAWAGGRAVMLHYTASCCVPQAELLVVDIAGNMRSCRLTASQQRALREKNHAPCGTAHALLTLVLWILVYLMS
ncbi:von Willebrand factor A domain-containing protein 7 isoform X2 [Brachyhypopomus gauderio]|uniref:von Willebrand factor A domain-containing protein 7 isoform X2 n=1 Tax=Brachyhypopomus gauderio TaxID=698409 RepID=UPI0040429798